MDKSLGVVSDQQLDTKEITLRFTGQLFNLEDWWCLFLLVRFLCLKELGGERLKTKILKEKRHT